MSMKSSIHVSHGLTNMSSQAKGSKAATELGTALSAPVRLYRSRADTEPQPVLHVDTKAVTPLVETVHRRLRLTSRLLASRHSREAGCRNMTLDTAAGTTPRS
jgi:hypothetical protein